MKMSIDELDEEIRRIEARIARERMALEEAVNGCTNSVREAVTSPKTLIALLGLGFGIGKVMFGGGGKRAAPGAVPKAGMLGLLTGVAGTAFSLMQPKFGVGSIAHWAATKAFSRKTQPARIGTSRTPSGIS